jgi:NADPH2:quinone reductase
MKAAYITQAGGPEVLLYGDLDPPDPPGTGQVLIKNHAAGINPIDTKIRANADRFPVKIPAILGCDGAGIIEAVGTGVGGFNTGDTVYYCQCGFHERTGTYAEYTLVSADLVAHKPQSLDFVEAAAVPLVLITAWESLHDRARIQPGQKVLIHAGAGGVGHVALQLATLAGADVAVTVSNEKKASFVTSLAPVRIFNYRTDSLQDAVMDWTNGLGADIVFDTVGGKVLEQSFALTRYTGDVVTLLQPAADTDWTEARIRNLRLSLELMLTPVMSDIAEARGKQAGILEQCISYFDNGTLKIHVAETFTLQHAQQAHLYLEQQHQTGKLVFTI